MSRVLTALRSRKVNLGLDVRPGQWGGAVRKIMEALGSNRCHTYPTRLTDRLKNAFEISILSLYFPSERQ